ncbi:MAG: cell division protein SepF [Candidatus Woesearchaeota archaeon]
MVRKLFSSIKKQFDVSSQDVVGVEEQYVELSSVGSRQSANSKIIVRPFVLEDFSDVKAIVDVMREGYTIALVNIAPLKEKDVVELKRAINKLKKTVDAVDGDIAGFSDDYIIVAPSYAEIYRASAAGDEDFE